MRPTAFADTLGEGHRLIGGAATLVWFGIGSIRAKSEHGGQEEQSERAEKELNQAGFLHGILLTLTNPLTILFWSGVFGSLMASRTLSDSFSLFVFAVGCMVATLLFLSLVAVLGTYMSKALQPSWIKRMNVVVGIFLIGFAIVLLLKGWTV